MDDRFPPAVTCSGCGRDVPNGAIYCPHCCGDAGRLSATRCAALRGGLLGLLAGVLVATAWTALIGLDRATWGRAFGVVVTGVATGMLWGMLRQRGRH